MKYALALLLLVVSSAASAHYPWTEPQCKQFSLFVHVITDFRSAGSTMENTQKAASSAATEMHRNNPVTFFVKDNIDEQAVMKAVEQVYATPTWGPDALEKDAYDTCVKILVPDGKSV